MKKLLTVSAIATLALLGTGYASAETYEGVLVLQNSRPRAEVSAEAVAATQATNPYAEGAQAGAPAPVVSARSRDSVRDEAVATALSPNQNIKIESRVNSVVRRDAAARLWNSQQPQATRDASARKTPPASWTAGDPA